MPKTVFNYHQPVLRKTSFSLSIYLFPRLYMYVTEPKKIHFFLRLVNPNLQFLFHSCTCRFTPIQVYTAKCKAKGYRQHKFERRSQSNALKMKLVECQTYSKGHYIQRCYISIFRRVANHTCTTCRFELIVIAQQ